MYSAIAMGRALLDIQGVRKSFGGVLALRNVNLVIEDGGIVGLIGPNGAGKTTLINVVSGFIKPDGGRIIFDGRDITGQPPHKVARAGASRTFQIPKILRNLTVEENIKSAHLMAEEVENLERGRRLLKIFGLERLLEHPAKSLSGGQQKLLEFVRAVVHGGRLIMLDEPVGGVHPDMIGLMGEVIRDLNREYNITFLIVEHNIPFVSEICGKIFVMGEGSVIAAGAVEEVLETEAVIEAYLGGGDASG
ncbi:Lipopolysaccharide export system ATP-binding protein LptB [archaeon HR01]|nr:Lipopolysaccharide export system ATP-binding protein LptB [archaeon HR01]